MKKFEEFINEELFGDDERGAMTVYPQLEQALELYKHSETFLGKSKFRSEYQDVMKAMQKFQDTLIKAYKDFSAENSKNPHKLETGFYGESGIAQYLFNFVGGGWNSIRANSKEEAKEKIKEKFGKGVSKPDYDSIRPYTKADYDHLMSMFN